MNLFRCKQIQLDKNDNTKEKMLFLAEHTLREIQISICYLWREITWVDAQSPVEGVELHSKCVGEEVSNKIQAPLLIHNPESICKIIP
jgi:hypothetical protein